MSIHQVHTNNTAVTHHLTALFLSTSAIDRRSFEFAQFRTECTINSTRVDEGAKSCSLLVTKMKAGTVVGRGEKSLPCDPRSEQRLGTEKEKEKREDSRRDDNNNKKKSRTWLFPIHPPIHACIHRFIHRSAHPPIDPSIHSSAHTTFLSVRLRPRGG